MTDKLWKQVERDVALLFGVRRKIGSGCDVSRDGGDLDHERLHVEVKQRKGFEVLRWWDKAESMAHKEGKLPVLIIRAKGDSRLFIVAPLGADYLLKVGKELKDARTITGEEDGDGIE